MGVNFYLRRTKPILCFPEFHIGKRSFGWKALYQANSKQEDLYPFETQRPVVETVADIEAAVESGEWEIVDEYGTGYSFSEFIDHMETDFEKETARNEHMGLGSSYYQDADGREYERYDFI